MHIHPSSLKRQAHQNTFNPGSRRSQTKRRAAIMHEVELNVSPSAQLLPLFLLRGEGHVFPLLDQGEVGGEESAGAVLHEAEDLLRIVFRGVEIVEEDAANAARFFAVWDVEMLVAPGFEAGVETPVVLVASFFDGFVEMDGIFVKEVRGCQIGSTPEPPSVSVAVRVHRLEITVIEMHGRGHWVPWMQDQA